jgi:hypothetical protein
VGCPVHPVALSSKKRILTFATWSLWPGVDLRTVLLAPESEGLQSRPIVGEMGTSVSTESQESESQYRTNEDFALRT